MTRRVLRIQEDKPFDAAAETAALGLAPEIGALVTFTGLCRDEGGTLAALEIECIIRKWRKPRSPASPPRPKIAGRSMRCSSSIAIGLIRPGEAIVLVATASAHRGAAFEAAEFLMDFFKTRAPFWKKQHRSGGGGAWVAAKDDDEAAAARWIEDIPSACGERVRVRGYDLGVVSASS